MKEAKRFKACVYARLSQDDGDKAESDSITSQKALIRDYIAKHSEIREVSVKVDDGYSGVNFERPGFQEMLQEIRAGKVNCVIVKDLSRFGRNYIEAGNFIEKEFPLLGVRFIAINDDYDSLEQRNSDSLLIPFKNLINDAYSKDISVKIRTQFEIKRKEGQFIGGFEMYGYLKDEKDHNHLVPDPYAAEVVRQIFKWKIMGMSAYRIADKLNADGVLSPGEYKKSRGRKLYFKTRGNAKALWSAQMLLRILSNEVYTGTLVQGKTYRPNHKVRKSLPKDKDKWVRVEGTHEAIIDKKTFQDVQILLQRDTRSGPEQELVPPFSGYLFCADCEGAVGRHYSGYGDKKCYSYMCIRYITKRSCCAHYISEQMLMEAVLQLIRVRVETVMEMEELLKVAESVPRDRVNGLIYEKQVTKLRAEIEKNQMFKLKLLESLEEEMIAPEEYEHFKKLYDKKIAEIEKSIHVVEHERNLMLKKDQEDYTWMETFKKYRNISEIDRVVVVELIDRIIIGEGKRIEVRFRYGEQFDAIRNYLVNLELMREDEHGVLASQIDSADMDDFGRRKEVGA